MTTYVPTPAAERWAAAAKGKPRIRVPAGSTTRMNDSFQNFTARLGIGTDNIASDTRYTYSNLLTRMPRALEYMYRGSWMIGVAVDSVAEDMTAAGIDFGAALKPNQIEPMTEAMQYWQIWPAITDMIRWGRLYGGAVGIIMIEGADMSTPLDPNKIGKDMFKGILALDRWCLDPVVTDYIEEMGPDIGRQEFYFVNPTAPALVGERIHHSRVIRAEGIKLPVYQRYVEQGWGLSIVERIYDRLLGFDSASVGAGQLVYKAHLRTIKIEGLREILAQGGALETALVKQMEGIRKFQTSEGLTLIDGKDDFLVNQYTFAGLPEIIMQFGEQISGATQIPLVRLFGQSPSGLNSSGESDLRTYYDGIKRQQENMRFQIAKVLRIMYRSTFGSAPPAGFTFKFNPLWQLTEEQKAAINAQNTAAVVAAFGSGIVPREVALKELRQSSDVTGVWSNISDDDIKEAKNDPPEPTEMDLIKASAEAKAAAGGGAVDDGEGTPGEKTKQDNKPVKAAA